MNCKLVILLLAFNIIYLSLFHTGECFRFLRRGRNHRRNELMVPPDRPVGNLQFPNSLQRQAPFSTLFSGPLALATFLFALPLLPSLVMAPLALAGIPPALNVLSNVVSTFTSGKPFHSVMSALSDPLHTSASTSSGSSASGDSAKPSASSFVNLDALKNIARVFRMAISRRHMIPLKIPSSQESPIVPDKVQVELEELASTALNTTIEAINDTNSTSPVAEMEKSIRAMDAVYSSIREVYSVIRNGLRRYEITDSDCQSRIVCEIHQKIISRNKMLKTFSLGAIDLLSLEKHVDSWSSLNEKSRQAVKFYIKAAKIGFADKDCIKEFGTCPTLTLKNTINLVPANLMFNRHLLNL